MRTEKYSCARCRRCSARRRPMFLLTANGLLSLSTMAVLFLAWTLLALGSGQYLGMRLKRGNVMAEVERTIQDCVAEGRPFVFREGRLGVVVEERRMTGYGQNRLIAYRAIQFVYPEEDPMWMPVRKFGSYGEKGAENGQRKRGRKVSSN